MASVSVEPQLSVVTRVASLPLVSSTCDLVSSAYISTKDQYPYLKSLCEMAEKGMKTITSVAVTSALPIIQKLEPQIAVANTYACKGLDKIEEKLPILNQPTNQVVANAKGAMTGARDAMTTTVTGARDSVASTITGVVDRTKGAVTGSVEKTKSVVNGSIHTVMGSRVMQLMSSGMENALTKSELLVDQYLPLTKDELEKEAKKVEGFDTVQKPSYYVRLGSLSTKLRSRAYQQALCRVEEAKQKGQETISQLHSTVNLIELARKNVHNANQGWRGVVLLRTVSGLWQPGPDAAREWIIRLPSLLGCQRRCVSCVAGPAFSGPRLASASRPNGQNSALDCFLGLSQPDNSPFRVPAVSVHRDEQDLLLVHRPDMPENPRVLRVVLLGAPNAGKSTLSNQLLGRKVFPVSRKVHTTRSQALGVITEKETQVILLDTPGLISPAKQKRHHLELSLLEDPWKSMESADLVVVLVDVSDKWTRNQLSPQLLRCLTQFSHVPSILVMNKVDCLKQKSVLLELTAALTEGVVNGKKLKTRQALRSQPGTHCPSPAAQGPDLQPARDPQRMGWPHFQEIFMLSALSQEDVKTLKQYLLAQAQPGPWEFHSEVLTSQTPEEICANMIREKLLEYLPKEVPYNIQQKTEVWDEGPSGELVIEQKLLVPKESHMKILIGPKGYLIAQIAQEVGRDLMNIFLCEVQLRLSVKLIK